ncbi:MAG: MarR family transcriptional regulator [Lachnospiraceae bacterium]|nr:MarR family transcriptional regulator [Lachnospiraceae bacterium]
MKGVPMTKINEDLLDAWLRLSIAVNNPRLVTEITYNESLICNILYKHAHSEKATPLTATDLCKMTNMLKSQMNRTLNQLEEKNLISRERSTTDKRQVYVTMNLQQCHIYETQHKQILSILDAVISKLGYERSRDAIRILNAISEVAEQLNLGK